MRSYLRFALLPLFAVSLPVLADSPYAGQQQRAIKALSDQQVQGYLAGSGMGFAKAAELNHYPGPRHVLALAEQLELSVQQRAETQALFVDMQTKAQALGRELIAGEQALDQLFASAQVSPDALRRQVAFNARIEGQLRYTHLVTHLAQRDLLTPAQRAAYDRLRGYADGGPAHGAGHAH